MSQFSGLGAWQHCMTVSPVTASEGVAFKARAEQAGRG